MNARRNSKTRLLQACGSAAIALGTLWLPTQAHAQAFQATPNVVQGSAVIDRATPGVDTVTVVGLDAVIDWIPDEDTNGDALIFLPNGNTGIFQSQPGDPIFAVINRILPATNGNITVMDGAVISQLQQVSGPPVPGGFVMFYSSTGLIIGNGATFDVGGLVLTTLAPDISSFTQFVTGGGSIAFNGVSNDTSAVLINPGATIIGSQEGSAMAVVAPQIIMSGSVDMNGSVAYVAAQDATLAYADGLFDIIISTGTVVNLAIGHDGSTGGPASNGGTDNHVIYGVAQAQANPINLLFTGNLGFQPAINATTDNGDIILSANYDVTGRDLAGGIAGSDTFFDGRNETSSVEANISIFDGAIITSRLTAVGTDATTMEISNGEVMDVTGDVTLVGRGNASLLALNDSTINIDGNVLVSARNFAPVVGTLGQPGELDATGGLAQIYADALTSGGNPSINITGNAEVNARAISGVATIDLVAGSGTGGTAIINASTSAVIDIAGDAIVRANASGFQLPGLNEAGIQRGGNATIGTFADGQILIGGNATLEAMASAINTTGTAIVSPSNAFGGFADLLAEAGGSPGLVDIAGGATLDTSAFGSTSQPLGAPGGQAAGGSSSIVARNGSTINIGLATTMRADGNGSENANGSGGDGIGGSNAITTDTGASINLGGSANLFADGNAGNGISGGNGFGGVSRVLNDTGVITVDGLLFLSGQGRGGAASFGFGGDGGSAQGGHASVQATGNLVDTATINLAGNLTLQANAIGGIGGPGDGSSITPGAGGSAEGGSIANMVFAFPSVAGGSYILAGGDGGNIQLGANSFVRATAAGGRGGTAGTGQLGGDGGDATGGDAYVGTFSGPGDGSVALGSINGDLVFVNSTGSGGDGGFNPSSSFFSGIGGDGLGGSAHIQARYAPVTLGAVTLIGTGFGGEGSTGGNGTGNQAGMFIQQADAGSIFADSLLVFADGNGGAGTDGNGGDGTAGSAFAGFQGGAITVFGNTQLFANGTGGASTNGTGGIGVGGIADLADFSGVPGTGTFQGTSSLVANGFGGDSLSAGFDGGSGIGGVAYLFTQTDSTLSGGAFQLSAQGTGGDAVDGTGGIGEGGEAYSEANGSNSAISASTISMAAGSFGGASSSGIGGSAFGGFADFTALNGGAISVVGDAVANTATSAGAGSSGGDTFGGESVANVGPASSLSAGNLDLNANTDTAASSGGSIEGGLTDLNVSGSGTVTATTAVLSANAAGATGGTATAGSGTVALDPSASPGLGQIAIGQIFLEFSAEGGTTNIAGDFDIATSNGPILFQNLTGTALGDSANDSISLFADGSDIAITGSALIEAVGDIEFITQNGGLIVGGSSPVDLSADFFFDTLGTITISGDDDNLPSFGALSMTLASSDIDVPLGARFGAVDLTLISNNTAHGAVIGGVSNGLGWTLTQDEAARIEATNVFFDGPLTSGGDPYDVEIRDTTIFGSLDDGVSRVSVFSAGTLGVVGEIDFQFASSTDSLQLGAGQRIDIVIDAGGAIYLTDGSGNLAGDITMFAPSIFAVDADTLAQLLVDPESSGLPEVLAAEPGFSEPDAYIEANSVNLFPQDYIYTQNWGANGVFSGIAVGPGGLTLQQDGDNLVNPLNAIVYGIQVNGPGDFTTNSDFFEIVIFNLTPSNHFTTSSTLNNCLIVDGICGGSSGGEFEEEVEEVLEVVTTSTYTQPPPEVTAQVTAVVEASEADTAFGLDFPSLFNPPTVQEQGAVRDPVTSGGDSATYADNDGSDEEEDQDDS